MPVKSSNSAVLRWPGRDAVLEAARAWAAEVAASHRGVVCIGCFGSIATGCWGPGSDLDLVIGLDRCDLTFERRGTLFDTAALPVPVDLLVYTTEELDAMRRRGSRFTDMLDRDVLWLHRKGMDG